MTKLFYRFAIFLLVLSMVQDAFVNGVVQLADDQHNPLYALVPFLFVQLVTHTLGSLLLLLYYREKDFRLSYAAGWLCVMVTSAETGIIWELMMGENVENWYFVFYGAVHIANLLLGISLIISESRERKWLKWAGILLITIEALAIIMLIWYWAFADLRMDVLDRLGIWLLGPFIAINGLFVMNLIDELRGAGYWRCASATSRVAVVSIGLILLVLTAFLGLSLYISSTTSATTTVVSNQTAD
ncbi:hypothetical protein SAMN05216327_102493 [Dyadobacter sp. SG02]|uniref:hypothetical protein n=1 Tax=Dyadobacter sp. SG02 TaxID=1855291 RepID=UPI0008D0A437|nr:hypothetical protein [Dyadobacter sp. SG02]SEI56631.1 hypothetical protein SAMN05216327_102493 [Dyadobacter sp. SG02]